MSEITKISRQKKNAERYNIYLDNKYAFSVDENVLVQFQLTKGKELDDLTIDEMVFEDEVRKAFNKALHYLGFRMRSEFEVKKKLLDSEFGEAVVLEAIQKLNELGFLNDETFTQALLNTQKATGKKGPKSIRQEFRKKGIDKELQEEILSTYSEKEQISIATELAEKVARTERGKTPFQVKQKIQETLLRKGYGFEVIGQVVEIVEIELEEDDWDLLLNKQGEKIWNKYSGKYKGSELHYRVKQALYQKGVPSERIDRFIERKEAEEDGE
ncbi:recombination regulator RecX [Chungangia koreensis]|uniref:Regulatory protein RecX n=1 Tax=Chungangia koreensis TaxID=752657 RepID=A0ABV8X6F4_9LACT